MNFASIRYAYNCQVTYEYYDKGTIHSATMIIRTYAQSGLEALHWRWSSAKLHELYVQTKRRHIKM